MYDLPQISLIGKCIKFENEKDEDLVMKMLIEQGFGWLKGYTVESWKKRRCRAGFVSVRSSGILSYMNKIGEEQTITDIIREKYGFLKEDLKDGMIVETTDEFRYMVMGNKLLRNGGYKSITLYNRILDHSVFRDVAIVKIYKLNINKLDDIEDIFKLEVLELIWERPQIPNLNEEKPKWSRWQSKSGVLYRTKNRIVQVSVCSGIYGCIESVSATATAKCLPEDEFDIDFGIELAKAKANERLARKMQEKLCGGKFEKKIEDVKPRIVKKKVQRIKKVYTVEDLNYFYIAVFCKDKTQTEKLVNYMTNYFAANEKLKIKCFDGEFDSYSCISTHTNFLARERIIARDTVEEMKAKGYKIIRFEDMDLKIEKRPLDWEF